jgi:hypothetical protein
MNHCDTAHKLGAAQALQDFTAWLQNDDGNPTEFPKKRATINVKTAAGILGGQSSTCKEMPEVCNPGGAGKPTPPPPPPPPTPKTAEEIAHAVLQKLGKTIARKPIGKNARFATLKEKLRKQKPKKA